MPATGNESNKSFLIPTVGGLWGIIIAVHLYQPLDHDYFYFAGLFLFFLPFGRMVLAKRRGKYKRIPPSSPFKYLSLGCPLIFALLVVNGALDSSQPEQKVVLVSKKCATVGRMRSYMVEFPSWRRNGSESLDVNARTYSSMHAGEPIVLQVHRGRLGFTWVNNVHAAP